MYKNTFTVLLIVGAILAAGLVLLRPDSPNSTTPGTTATNTACTLEAKMCPDGSFVGRSGPNCEFAACPVPNELPPDLQAAIDAKADLITVTQPQPLTTVTSPITVSGEARGYWYFEGSFPLVVTNWDGLIIGEGFATADGEWMTEDFVPFVGTVSYTAASGTPYASGTLIFKKDNPSGLPENDDALELPVRFGDI